MIFSKFLFLGRVPTNALPTQWSQYLKFLEKGLQGGDREVKLLQCSDTTASYLGIRYRKPKLHIDKNQKGSNSRWKVRRRICQTAPLVNKNDSEAYLSEQHWHATVSGDFLNEKLPPHHEAVDLICQELLPFVTVRYLCNTIAAFNEYGWQHISQAFVISQEARGYLPPTGGVTDNNRLTQMQRMDTAAKSYLIFCPENHQFALTFAITIRGWRNSGVKALQVGFVKKFFQVQDRTIRMDPDLIYEAKFGSVDNDMITFKELYITNEQPLGLIITPQAIELIAGGPSIKASFGVELLLTLVFAHLQLYFRDLI